MPTIQISKIQVRTGAEALLPQLAEGELGFCTDTKRLFIGNAPSPTPTPTPNNTEILTSISTGSSSAAGANGDVQFNLGGNFSANSNVQILSGKLTTANDISVSGLTLGVGGSVVNSFSVTNSVFGYQAMENTVPSGSDGRASVAIGRRSLRLNTTGARNVAVGGDAAYNNLTGSKNTAVGEQSMYHTQSGSENVAVGAEALFGDSTLPTSWTGVGNIAVGYQSAKNISTGNYNTALGSAALFSNKTGSTNIALGKNAGSDIVTGSNNTIIGSIAGDSALASTVILAAGTSERLRINSTGAWSTDAGSNYGSSGYSLTSGGSGAAPAWKLPGAEAVYTVATLPTAPDAVAGARAMVTDANSTSFASVVAAGGSNKVPVYYDGSSWRIG